MDNIPTTFGAAKLRIGVLLVLVLALNWWPTMDKAAEVYLAEAITDNLVIFATARSLNGIISVVQSIELSVSLGAGFGVHLGEVLDPLNDLIERFSGFVLYGLASLGLQKLVLVATSSLVMKVLVSGVLVGAYFYWLVSDRFAKPLLRILVLLLIVRFALVVEVGGIAALDHLYFDERTRHAHSALELVRDTLSNLRQSYLKAASEGGMVQGFVDAGSTLFGSEESGGVSEIAASAIVELIVITLVRGLLLPLMFFWVVVATFRRLLR